MSCKVKVNRHGFLALRIFWNGLRTWEGTGLKDTAENRKLVDAAALVISTEIKNGTFDYGRHFPKGNLRRRNAHLFGAPASASPSQVTVQAYYDAWMKRITEGGQLRAHRPKDYHSIKRHLLPARLPGGRVFGKIPIGFLTVADLKALQAKIKALGFKAATVNGYIHSCLRAMIRDARIDGLVTMNLYDKTFFPSLPLTDTETSIDPYTPEERETILGAFKARRPHYYPFVFFQFWTGCRPSETTALRWRAVDLRYQTARIQKSRVQGKESGTKTRPANREIHLHENLTAVLKAHKPLHVKPEDYVFMTPDKTPVDASNFYKREWLAALRGKEIRPRPFYNTRHSYVSFLFSIGATPGFISKQTGDSIKTLEKHYAKYIEEADTRRDLVEAEIRRSETSVQPPSPHTQESKSADTKKPLKNQRLKDGAGEEGRTPDLMLGKHRGRKKAR